MINKESENNGDEIIVGKDEKSAHEKISMIRVDKTAYCSLKDQESQGILNAFTVSQATFVVK